MLEPAPAGRSVKKHAELDALAAVRLTILMVLVAASIVAVGVFRLNAASGSRPVSRSRAEELLQRSIAYVHSNDRHALCELERAQGPCIFEARTLDQVQVTEPVVVGFRREMFFETPIAVLELCMRVNGQPLYNDYVVIRTSDGIQPFYAAYWIQRLAVNGNITTPAHRSVLRIDSRCSELLTAD